MLAFLLFSTCPNAPFPDLYSELELMWRRLSKGETIARWLYNVAAERWVISKYLACKSATFVKMISESTASEHTYT